MSRLSVIITTYNRRKLLPQAIASVQQCGTDAAIIVVDDASSDGTKEYCESLSGIRYLRMERNRGTAAARNTGIRACNTEYIAFLDDDDWRLPGTFEPQLEILEKNRDCHLVYGPVLYANQQQELNGRSNTGEPAPQGRVMLDLIRRNFITLSSVVVRKEQIVRDGMFDEAPEMLGLEDWDMWIRMSVSSEIRAVEIPVAVYRQPEQHSGQWYSDLGRQYILAGKAYKNKWFHLPALKARLGSELGSFRRERLMHVSDVIIYTALHNGWGLRKRVSRVLSALRCRPQNLVSPRFYKGLVKAILNRP